MKCNTENKHRRYALKIWYALASFTIFSLLLLECIKSQNNVSINIPFDPSIKGNFVETDLLVTTPEIYGFYLNFYPNANDMTTRERLLKITGTGRRYSDGSLADSGVDIPIRLILQTTSSSRTETIFDLNIAKFPLVATSQTSLSKQIKVIRLNPGKYIIHLESSENNKVLSNVKIDFDIHAPSRK